MSFHPDADTLYLSMHIREVVMRKVYAIVIIVVLVFAFAGSAAVKPAERGAVKAKILVLHGADDKFTTPGEIEAFKQEMKAAGADFRFIAYPGAVHSFTNPEADAYARKFNLPLAYNAAADKKSWEELRKFFDKIFK